jgi:DNA-directed RNA polymerase delta subunit
MKQITGKRKLAPHQIENKRRLIESIDANGIMNGKELYSFSMITSPTQIPKDIFNIICDNIINEIVNHRTLKYAEFRDSLYDILIYNLDVSECVWYVLYHFIHEKRFAKTNMAELMDKVHLFLKYYNNNYRPIYHLESMFYTILINVHQYP